MCACRGARVLSATVELIAVLVNSEAIARACVVFEHEQVQDGQSQLLAVPREKVLFIQSLITSLFLLLWTLRSPCCDLKS